MPEILVCSYRATIDALRRAVKPRQAAILEALYGLDGGGGQLQKDVATQHNLTRARIYQIKEVCQRMQRA